MYWYSQKSIPAENWIIHTSTNLEKTPGKYYNIQKENVNKWYKNWRKTTLILIQMKIENTLN